MSATFLRYIAHGEAAVETHPDYQRGLEDLETAAVDTIASILHAIDSERGLTLSSLAAHGPATYAADILEQALRAYEGDFEDLEGDGDE